MPEVRRTSGQPRGGYVLRCGPRCGTLWSHTYHPYPIRSAGRDTQRSQHVTQQPQVARLQSESAAGGPAQVRLSIHDPQASECHRPLHDRYTRTPGSEGRTWGWVGA